MQLKPYQRLKEILFVIFRFEGILKLANMKNYRDKPNGIIAAISPVI